MTLPTAPFLPTADDTPGARFQKLVEIMRTLRSPKGCAWDRKQTLHTLRPYILEEAYEGVAAIDDGDPSAVCDELGDRADASHARLLGPELEHAQQRRGSLRNLDVLRHDEATRAGRHRI